MGLRSPTPSGSMLTILSSSFLEISRRGLYCNSVELGHSPRERHPAHTPQMSGAPPMDPKCFFFNNRGLKNGLTGHYLADSSKSHLMSPSEIHANVKVILCGARIHRP